MVKVCILFGQVVQGVYRRKGDIVELPFAVAAEAVRLGMMKRIG